MELQIPDLLTEGRVNVPEIIGNADKGGMENYLKSFFEHLSFNKFNVTCICPYESKFTTKLRSVGLLEIYLGQVEDDHIGVQFNWQLKHAWITSHT